MVEMESSCVPPGFRFHPTEEELVGYYLKRKVNSLQIDLNVIVDVDLYRMEPWDIEERCRLGYEEQNEWYFFNHKDRKYPTGTRTNRATASGFWKATGRDKAVLSKHKIIGMRKTLVFYKGRAPNGTKTEWIMHEYRLQTFEHGPIQEEGWVICRAFKKPSPTHKQCFGAPLSSYYYARPPSLSSNPRDAISQATNFEKLSFAPVQEMMFNYPTDFEIPQLDSPSISSLATNTSTIEDVQYDTPNYYVDWDVSDKLISANYIDPEPFAYQDLPILPGDYVSAGTGNSLGG